MSEIWDRYWANYLKKKNSQPCPPHTSDIVLASHRKLWNDFKQKSRPKELDQCLGSGRGGGGKRLRFVEVAPGKYQVYIHTELIAAVDACCEWAAYLLTFNNRGHVGDK